LPSGWRSTTIVALSLVASFSRTFSRSMLPLPPQDIELMAKHEDLCFQRGSRSQKSDQPTPDQPAELVHRAEDSADSLPQANRFRFATGTTCFDRTRGPFFFDRRGMLNNLWFTGEEWIKQP
jgi:hypothetical protein